jgi:hypothetical protein
MRPSLLRAAATACSSAAAATAFARVSASVAAQSSPTSSVGSTTTGTGNGSGATGAKKKSTEPQAPKSITELVVGLSTRSRHVFLSGRIDDDMAKTVIAQLIFLEQESPGVPIRLHISSGESADLVTSLTGSRLSPYPAPTLTQAVATCRLGWRSMT